MSPTSIVAYLALFGAAGFLFIFAALLLGRFLRARMPVPRKQEVYECGEPAVGSSFVRFDLRFYVVALLFIIFDVEVAFFFPWATVFGKATQLTDPSFEVVVEAPVDSAEADTVAGPVVLSEAAATKFRELGVADPQVPDSEASVAENADRIQSGARRLALAAVADMGVFFGVLLLGFAYVWRRGDLDWVRTASWRTAKERGREPP